MNFVGELLPAPDPAATGKLKREAILVLGMHRTGTSALSGVIHMLGARAPAHLQRGDEFNAKGYWESQAVVRLNDRILHAGGSKWNDWTAFDEDRISPGDRSRFDSEAAEVIAAEYGDARLILLKDPRMCRIAPFWLRGLDRAGIAPKIVVPIRNPLESAFSLLHRDDIPVQQGLLLWLRHVLDAERQTRGLPRCFLAFDDLLDDWRASADRISKTLGIAWPAPPAEASAEIDGFLRRELRHHESTHQDLEMRADAFDWVLAAYDCVTKLSTAVEPPQQILGRLDEIYHAFGQASRVLGPLVLQRELQIAENAAQMADLGRWLEEARQTLAQRPEEAERYGADLRAARASLSAREADLAHRTLQLRAEADELESYRRQATRDLVRARVALYSAAPNGLSGAAGSSRALRAVRRLFDALRSRRPGGRRRRREAEQAGLIRASGLFDAAWYLQCYQDVREAGIDPAIHYLRYGAAESRDPSELFSTRDYQQRYLDVATAGTNPLVHFLTFGIHEERQFERVSKALTPARRAPPQATGPEMRALAEGGMTAEHAKFTRRGEAYEEFDPGILSGVEPDVKLLAFYLPQFHAIPENDQFWGKGFTEWRQIVRGLPRFPGHYQPRIPSDLGFYDLNDRSVIRRQVELAKAAGINGFGFYYYWFDGRRVLERPVEHFLASPDIDMPFMAIWANENWTRTWDGMNGEILLRQSYDPAHESALLADLARHFVDSRYIRLEGRPFFVIYQPRHVPDPRATFARWRARWKSEHGVEPVIFMAQTFGVEDPQEFGLDGAIEFPPHKLRKLLHGRPVPDAFNPYFEGRVVRYEDIAAASLDEREPAYALIKTIMPGWDNDARRPMRGITIEGSTPAKYRDWLSDLVRRARERPVLGESIVCINAWNEWAEGAYLEPDVHFGSAYLNATARALLPQSRG